MTIFSVGFWAFTVLCSDISKTIPNALLWSRLAIIGPIFAPSFFLLFSLYFIKKSSILKRKWISFLILLPSICLSLFVFSSWNVKEVKIETWGTNFVPGPLYWLLMFLLITFIGYASWILYKKGLVASSKEKLQVKYIFIGALISMIFGILGGLIFPALGYGQASLFGPTSTLVFLVLTSYAIVRKELFGIKVLLTTLLIILITILLFADLIFFSDNTLARFAKIFILVIFLYFGYMLIKSVLREIKRREQLEKLTRQLEEANINLKKLDKAKSEFVSIASHQLRTPLTAIKGYISMALEGMYGQFDDKFTNVLKNVYSSNEELINLVNDLLNLSRIEAGKIKLESEMVDMDELLKAIINKLKINADQKGLIINHKLNSLPKISIDRDKIRQVILNLLDNAIKYTQKGEIIISSEKQKNNLIVKISDTGMGLNEEEMSNLFMSFKRGESGPKLHTEGSGLGLYIAKKFIDLHKGKIWAESEGKGKGSTFFISLPY
jgi:signal transduction histidine kinase